MAYQALADEESISHRIQRSSVSNSHVRAGHQLDRGLAHDRLPDGSEDPSPSGEVAQRRDQASIGRGRRKEHDIVRNVFLLLGTPSKAFGLVYLRRAPDDMNPRRRHPHIAAALGFGMVAVWLTAYCVSRWRQAKNERNSGNTLHEEVRRTLSRVEIDIWRFRSWPAGALQIAPIMIGGLLINWSVGRSQNEGADIPFMGWWMYLMPVVVTVYLVNLGRRHVKQKLEPRQKRLRELLAALEARE